MEEGALQAATHLPTKECHPLLTASVAALGLGAGGARWVPSLCHSPSRQHPELVSLSVASSVRHLQAERAGSPGSDWAALPYHHHQPGTRGPAAFPPLVFPLLSLPPQPLPHFGLGATPLCHSPLGDPENVHTSSLGPSLHLQS